MKPNPIVIITLPHTTDITERSDKIHDALSPDFLKDYYVFVLSGDVKYPNISVFYEKDFNQVKYDELKEIVETKMKSVSDEV